MRMITFSVRNAKEICRDPLTVCFSLGFPLVLLLLLSTIQANIPVPLFEIDSLAPGVVVFGLCFMTLFSAMLVSKDRDTSLLQRLYTTPLTAVDYILGYILPVLPIALAQALITFVVSIFLGFKVTIGLLYGMLLVIPISLFFIGMGLLFGSILNIKAVGGIVGALFTNVAAWLSGIWFDVELVGGAFEKIANYLPFIHAVELERAAVACNYSKMLSHIWWVVGYAVLAIIGAIVLFLRQMKKQ